LKKIRIYLATIEDRKDIWLWRNNKKNRVFLKKTNYINFENHKKWFKKKLNSKICTFYVAFAFKEKLKIGYVRFDNNNYRKLTYISIVLNPKIKGKKLSFFILKSAISKFCQKNKSIKIIALIKKNNPRSLKIFEKYGFALYKTVKKYRYYKYLVK
jgi:RimJ/RimL family protein N-acetyltransferase